MHVHRRSVAKAAKAARAETEQVRRPMVAKAVMEEGVVELMLRRRLLPLARRLLLARWVD
jgi:hypothetical protein